MDDYKISVSAHLAKHLQAAREEVNRLKEDLGDQMDCAADSLAEIQLNLVDLQAELDDKNRSIAALENENARLKARIQELEHGDRSDSDGDKLK